MVDLNEKYVCKLSPELLEKAKKELNEVPERRAEDIETLRQWLKKQPHIHGRTDDAFLLRFLRNCKFSIERAKEKIDKYYTYRTALPEWNTGLDLDNPTIQEIIKAGACVPLGYDKQGRRIVIGKMGNLDPSVYKLDDIFKANYIIMEYLLMDEQTQICGSVFLADAKGATASHMAQYTPAVAKRSMASFQDAMPVRMKSLNYFNTPAIFEALIPMVKTFMKSKLLNRLHFHGSNLKSLHGEIPPECLPTEYGGTAGDFDKFKDECFKALYKHKDYFKYDEQFKVDESKRPGKPKTLEDLFGMDGTFRKLTID